MIELFLMCSLSLPAMSFTRPPMVVWFGSNEEARLVAWLRKNNKDAEIFIHENPRVDKLKEYGYERIPFSYNNQQIWIRRKPVSDKRPRTGA